MYDAAADVSGHGAARREREREREGEGEEERERERERDFRPHLRPGSSDQGTAQ